MRYHYTYLISHKVNNKKNLNSYYNSYFSITKKSKIRTEIFLSIFKTCHALTEFINFSWNSAYFVFSFNLGSIGFLLEFIWISISGPMYSIMLWCNQEDFIQRKSFPFHIYKNNLFYWWSSLRIYVCFPFKTRQYFNFPAPHRKSKVPI